ncbi:MAG: hypothetical protein E6Z55_08315 [Peptoniphilus harei]|nr:hypothetical protein [Peptoniphilus harei]
MDIIIKLVYGMKILKDSKRKLVFILLIFVITIVSITACTNKPEKEIENDSYKFEQDSSLSKFINPNIQKEVLESDIGVVAPKLAFASDNYAGILNYNGLLIYNINDKKLSSAIDIKGLGFDQIQGDKAIDISSNNEYLILSKFGEKKGYIYSFEDKYLSKTDDISKIESKRAEYPNFDEINTVKLKIGEKDKEIDVIKTENRYVILILDYNNLKNSDFLEVDKNYDIVSKFKLYK